MYPVPTVCVCSYQHHLTLCIVTGENLTTHSCVPFSVDEVLFLLFQDHQRNQVVINCIAGYADYRKSFLSWERGEGRWQFFVLRFCLLLIAFGCCYVVKKGVFWFIGIIIFQLSAGFWSLLTISVWIPWFSFLVSNWSEHQIGVYSVKAYGLSCINYLCKIHLQVRVWFIYM